MKVSKQNQHRSFLERATKNKKVIIKKTAQAFSSSWTIGAILAVISAWTAGILYV